MKKILFPTDFSEVADNAFVYTLHLAKSMQAQIIVVHAFDADVLSSFHSGHPELVANVYTTMELGEFEQFKKEGQKLREIAEKHQLSDLKISFMFEAGGLPHILTKVAKKEGISMVVMGTSGASGFGKRFWGTNTLNAMQSMNLPVLSIPGSAEFHTIKNIGFTTVFKDSDKEILQELLTASEYFNAQIKVLHIIEYSGNVEKKEAFATEKINEWKHFFSSDKLDFVVSKADDLRKGVLGFTKSENIDALVIAKRNLSFIDSLFYSSLSDKLASKIDIPLLVIKEK